MFRSLKIRGSSGEGGTNLQRLFYQDLSATALSHPSHEDRDD